MGDSFNLLYMVLEEGRGYVQILCTIDDITPNYQIRMKRGNDDYNWTSWKKIVIE